MYKTQNKMIPVSILIQITRRHFFIIWQPVTKGWECLKSVLIIWRWQLSLQIRKLLCLRKRKMLCCFLILIATLLKRSSALQVPYATNSQPTAQQIKKTLILYNHPINCSNFKIQDKPTNNFQTIKNHRKMSKKGSQLQNCINSVTNANFTFNSVQSSLKLTRIGMRSYMVINLLVCVGS